MLESTLILAIWKATNPESYSFPWKPKEADKVHSELQNASSFVREDKVKINSGGYTTSSPSMITEPGTAARLLYTFMNDNGIIWLENVLQQQMHFLQRQRYNHDEIDMQCGN